MNGCSATLCNAFIDSTVLFHFIGQRQTLYTQSLCLRCPVHIFICFAICDKGKFIIALHIFHQTFRLYIFGLAGQVRVKLGNFRLFLANASAGHMACHRRQIPTKFNTPGRSDKHHHQSTKWFRGLGGTHCMSQDLVGKFL